VYAQADIYRFYDQGVDRIVRLVFQLTDKIEDLEAQLINKPERVNAHLTKELQSAKRTLARKLITHAPETCSSCRAALTQGRPRSVIRRQVFDISEGRVRVTEHRAEARLCTQCRKTTRAEFPASVRAPVQ
jgi:hypothetical protein